MTEKTSNVSNISEKLYMQLNASELSAISMKGSPNSNDRDAGFCSGSSEGGDDLSMDQSSRLDPSSPTNVVSDDSAEVKVMPMALIRNKRKSSEPSKVICEREETSMGPLKKRIRYTSSADSAVAILTPPSAHSLSPPPPLPTLSRTPTASPIPAIPKPNTTMSPNQATTFNIPISMAPFQTAIALKTSPWERLPHELMPNPAEILIRHPGVTTLHRLPPDAVDMAAVAGAMTASADLEVQQEPLALVLKKRTDNGANGVSNIRRKNSVIAASPQSSFKSMSCGERTKEFEDKTMMIESAEGLSSAAGSTLPPPPPPPPTSLRLPSRESIPPSSVHSKPTHSSSASSASSSADESFAPFKNTSSRGSGSGNAATSSSSISASATATSSRPHQRNYKNMTRERRIEANARERTRVHTISAAYETLRKAVPSYSNSQKLSKLSVLRVACSYILTLSRMVGLDYSEDQSAPSIASCFEAVTATIQTEGKLRKKKDE